MPETNMLLDPAQAVTVIVPVQPIARPPHTKPGVLVADDDHLIRAVVQLGLERAGFEVWLASSGPAAIDLYQEHRDDIDIVLLDVHMPGLDGPATLDALLELNPDLRACFLSGNTLPYTHDDLRRCGAMHVLDKPFLMHDLAHTLRGLVEQGVPAHCLPAVPH